MNLEKCVSPILVQEVMNHHEIMKNKHANNAAGMYEGYTKPFAKLVARRILAASSNKKKSRNAYRNRARQFPRRRLSTEMFI